MFGYEGKIIDAHLHPYAVPENNIAAFGSPKTEEDFFAELKRCGFSKVCGSVIPKVPTNFKIIKQMNRIALKLRDRHPDFYVPGIHIHGK